MTVQNAIGRVGISPSPYGSSIEHCKALYFSNIAVGAPMT